MSRTTTVLSILFFSLFINACSEQDNPGNNKQQADTIYINGKIYTVNEKQPWAEAVAIKDGKFIKVGSNTDVQTAKGDNTTVVDLDGKFAMPGVVDAHVHPFLVYIQDEAGNLLLPANANADEIAKSLKQFAAANPDRKWIRAEKYELSVFPGGKMTRQWLDNVLPDRPALVFDATGHNATANSKALTIAGITKDTPNPPLGAIEKDPKTGEPTGYLAEAGISLVGQHMDRIKLAAVKRATERALNEMTQWGITSFIDMFVYDDALRAYQQLENEGKLPFRVNAAFGLNEYTDEYITVSNAEAFISSLPKYNSHLLDTNHFKYWGDGTPLSYTALLVEPYSNKDTHGEMTMNDKMKNLTIELLGKGMAGHNHATGDGTVREVLNLVEEARKRYPGKVRRFHIGHCHSVHPDDIPRFNQLDVVAEVSPPMWFPQPGTDLLPDFLGEKRTARWIPIKEMLDAGVRVAYGSDWPSGTPTANPWRSLEGLVTREDPWEKFPGKLGEPIDLKSAIHMVTMGSAYAMEKENEIGSIEIGKHADFVVLDRDLFNTAVKELHKTTVLLTVFAGESVYQKIE